MYGGPYMEMIFTIAFGQAVATPSICSSSTRNHPTHAGHGQPATTSTHRARSARRALFVPTSVATMLALVLKRSSRAVTR